MGFAVAAATSLPSDQKLNPASSYQGWVEALLPPPGAFSIAEFVGNLQRDVVPDCTCMMFPLLYQPTAGDPDRPPALVVMENSLPHFTPISFSALAASMRALCFQSPPCQKVIALPPNQEVMT